MINLDHIYMNRNDIFDFKYDVAKIHAAVMRIKDKFELYEWAASEKRSIIRQFPNPSIDAGLFEPFPNANFVLISQDWDFNSQYFIQTFKNQ